MDTIIEELYDIFIIFNNDLSYYEEIVNSLSCDKEDLYDEAYKTICNNINKEIKDGNIDWLIKYVNSNSFANIAELLFNYNIIVTISLIQLLITKCPNFDMLLKNLLKDKEKYTLEDIEKLGFDETEIDIIYNYAIVKGLIEEEIDHSLNNKSDNSDCYCVDIRQNIINEAELNKDYEHNDEYLEKYRYYIKLKDDKEQQKAYDTAIRYRDKIVEGNQFLVIKMCKRFKSQKLEFEDLWVYGNFGLINAIETYDPAYNCNFSTYASCLIRQSIIRNINKYEFISPFRIPVSKQKINARVNEAINTLSISLMRKPTIKEIAEYLGISIEDVNSSLKLLQQPLSFDYVLYDSQYKGVVADFSFEDDLINKCLNRVAIEQLLSNLNQKDEFIIRMYYGISDGNNPLFDDRHTLEEIGKELNVSRERIRQKKVKSFRRIRLLERVKFNNSVCEYYHDYFWYNFKGKDRDEVLDKIRYLSYFDRKKLEIYGDGYKGHAYVTNDNESDLIAIIKRIKAMFEDHYYKPIYTVNVRDGISLTYFSNPDTLEKEIVEDHYFAYEGFCLEELFGINYKKRLEDLKGKLLKIYKKAFGNNLDLPAYTASMSKEEIDILRNSIFSLETISNQQFGVNLMDMVNCNYDELLTAIVLLDNKEWKKFLQNIFGSNYTRKVLLNRLTKEEKSILDEIIKLIGSCFVLMQKDKKMIIFEGKKVEDILGCSKEIFDYIISKNKKYLDLIAKQNNGETFTPEEAKQLQSFIEQTISSLPLYEKRYAIKNGLLEIDKNHLEKLCRHYECSEEEMLYVLTCFDDYYQLYDVLVSETIIHPFGKEEFDVIVKIDNHVKKILKKYRKLNNVDSLEKKIETPLIDPIFNNMITLLPEEYQKIMELRLGFADGLLHTIEQIAFILDMDTEIVRERVEKGMIIFNQFINNYRILFGIELSLPVDVKDCQLKREKE